MTEKKRNGTGDLLKADQEDLKLMNNLNDGLTPAQIRMARRYTKWKKKNPSGTFSQFKLEYDYGMHSED